MTLHRLCRPQSGNRLTGLWHVKKAPRSSIYEGPQMTFPRCNNEIATVPIKHSSMTRFMSTTAATEITKTDTAKDITKGEAKKEDKNIFLDNLGTVFLGTIGIVILALVRSSYGGTNKNNQRDLIEDEASLDPLEIDDLRVANCELTPEAFRSIMESVTAEFSQGTARYEDFVFCVRKKMIQMKGDAFTIELGHLMDRAVERAIDLQGKTKEDELSVVFLLTTLSLALDLEASVSDRIRILYDTLKLDGSNVTYNDVVEMVGYLQQTSQLAPETQVILGDSKIPTQQYKVASPHELIEWDGPGDDIVDVQGFADILRSKSVCAWGECYFKKKPSM